MMSCMSSLLVIISTQNENIHSMLDELISKIFNREIIARDRNLLHHFSKMGFVHAMTAGETLSVCSMVYMIYTHFV